jgi:WD40 repeat protein
VNSVFFVGATNDILTAAADGTVRVWDAERGIETRRFTLANAAGRTLGIKTAALSATFTQIFVGLNDNTVRLLRVLPEKEDLVSWTLSSRFIRPLDCNEKILYGILEPVQQVFVAENTTVAVVDSTNRVIATLTAGEAVQVLSAATSDTVTICAANQVEGSVVAEQLQLGE